MMRDWSGDATKAFKGKVVKKIRYTTEGELDDLGWDDTAPIVFFTDGSYLMPSADDEGNSGGVFFTSADEIDTIPRGGM